eukprot:scaffold23831_cov180-Amphora_coffeaeformis.AAC.5
MEIRQTSFRVGEQDVCMEKLTVREHGVCFGTACSFYFTTVKVENIIYRHPTYFTTVIRSGFFPSSTSLTLRYTADILRQDSNHLHVANHEIKDDCIDFTTYFSVLLEEQTGTELRSGSASRFDLYRTITMIRYFLQL